MYAAWWAGLVVVPVNAKLHAKEVDYIVEQSRRALRDRVARGRHAASRAPRPSSRCTCDSADLAWLFYTSGTTGRPKGAMLSHRNLAQMTYGYFADVDGVDRDGRLLHAAPLSHGSGLYNFTHLATGAAQVVPGVRRLRRRRGAAPAARRTTRSRSSRRRRW